MWWHAIISLQVCMFAQASSNELQEVFVVGDIGKVLPPFIYLLHLSKNFLFKNLLHISLGLARIYCLFAAHWLPPVCIYYLFTTHWLFLAYDSSYALSTR
jgi:hypothetical protein